MKGYSAFMQLVEAFFQYLSACFRHWGPLLTGGIALVLSLVLERVFKEQPPQWLWVTIIIASFFIASFLAWREMKQDKDALAAKFDSREKRKLIREELGKFMSEGTGIQVQCETRIPPTPNDQTLYMQFAQWDQKITAYLMQ